MGLGGGCDMYMGYLSPFGVEGHFEVIRCTCLKMACKSYMANRRAKLSEICDPAQLWHVYAVTLGVGGSCNKYMGYL